MNARYVPERLLLFGAALLCLLPACAKEEDDPPPPDPVVVLVENGGGTGGGAQNGTVTVVAFDEQDDARIEGATVLLDDGTVHEETTDANGEAVFSGVAPGTFDVTLVKSGYVNLSLFGFEASLVVMPLASPRIEVSGTVVNVSSTSNDFDVAFLTRTPNPFENDEPTYGEVIKQPTGSDLTYEVEIDKNRSDTLLFTETRPDGRIVNRKTLDIGPCTSDQTGVNLTFDGTTGLHEISGTISSLQQFLTTGVSVTYEDPGTGIEYENWDINGSGTTRTYTMQLPPDRTLDLFVDVNTVGMGSLGIAQEMQRFTVTTGGADNGTPADVDLPLDMVDISGTFSNEGAATYFIMAMRFQGRDCAVLGTPGGGYSLRMPRGVGARIAVLGPDGSDVLQKALAEAFGPFASDNGTYDFDLAGAAPDISSITANRPAGITTHDASAALLPMDADDRLIWPPTGADGVVGTSDITFDLRYISRAGARYVFMLSDEENTGSAQTFHLRGDIADPAASLGTSLDVTLLEIPDVTSPGATTDPEVVFSWNTDANLAPHGFRRIEVEENATGTDVWYVIAEGSLNTVTLPALPASVSSLALQSGLTYRWEASAFWGEDLDPDAFQIDRFQDVDRMIHGDKATKVAKTESFLFTVN